MPCPEYHGKWYSIGKLLSLLLANAVTKSNFEGEAYVQSAMTIHTPAPVIPKPSISRQKWVEEQPNDPNIGEVKLLWELKKLRQGKHKKEDFAELALLLRQRHTYCMRVYCIKR